MKVSPEVVNPLVAIKNPRSFAAGFNFKLIVFIRLMLRHHRQSQEFRW